MKRSSVRTSRKSKSQKSAQRKTTPRKKAVAAKSPAVPAAPHEPGSWEYMFRMLVVFQRTHGHCEVPYTARSGSLGHWLMQQRLAELAGDLATGLHVRLEELGVQFDSHDLTETKRERRWSEMFEALQEFKDSAGHCHVPAGRLEYSALSRWAYAQRHLHRKGRLRRDRVRRLQVIGFDLERKPGERNPRSPGGERRWEAWQKRLGELAAFKERHGHCNVFLSDEAHCRLATWLYVQRSRARSRKLAAQQREHLERLGVSFDSRRHDHSAWESMFAELAAYRKTRGDCDVPKRSPEHPQLAAWVYSQRSDARQGCLLQSRRERLAELGLQLPEPDLESRQAWNLMHQALAKFHTRFGHCDVPRNWVEPPGLYQWLVRQRRDAVLGKLSPSQAEGLEALGVQWKNSSRSWEERFAELMEFKKVHGHCRASAYLHGSNALANWSQQQRMARRRGQLSEERIRRLDEAGFEWQPGRDNQVQAARWVECFTECTAYIRAQGHGRVPVVTPGHPSLGRWAAIQRRKRNLGKLSADRIARLDALGFDWEPKDPRWDEKFAALEKFKVIHGHSHVPASYDVDPSLGGWVSSQRADYRAGLLAADRIRRLEELGFEWRPARRSRFCYDREWENRFRQLQEFKSRFQHCFVPQAWPENRSLGLWVSAQRTDYQGGKLLDHYKQRLNEIGLEWIWRDVNWDIQIARAEQFHRDHGHLRVPINQPAWRELHGWLVSQRHRRKELSEHQQQRLEALGFDWAPYETQWRRAFDRLAEFHRQSGHWNVVLEIDYRDLAHWVAAQRQLHKRGNLRADRIAALDAIGFDWTGTGNNSGAFDHKWEKMFAVMEGFHREHGHCDVPPSQPQWKALHQWAAHQRKQRQRGALKPRKIERLDRLGFCWKYQGAENRWRDLWEKRFAELVAYQQEHGHCEVARSQNSALWKWIRGLRKRREQLSMERRQRLDAIGFVWERPLNKAPVTRVADGRWDAMLAMLEIYKAGYGHCEVSNSRHQVNLLPVGTTETPPPSSSLLTPAQIIRLAAWSHDQREALKQERLRPDRHRRLLALGWTPQYRDVLSERHLLELADFKARHGHCNVPRQAPWGALSDWVTRQRNLKRDGRIDAKIERQLDNLGFVWDWFADRWEHRFALLREFQRVHGHCGVTRAHSKLLEFWCQRQRRLRAAGKLSPDNVRRLDEVGFAWELKRPTPSRGDASHPTGDGGTRDSVQAETAPEAARDQTPQAELPEVSP